MRLDNLERKLNSLDEFTMKVQYIKNQQETIIENSNLQNMHKLKSIKTKESKCEK